MRVGGLLDSKMHLPFEFRESSGFSRVGAQQRDGDGDDKRERDRHDPRIPQWEPRVRVLQHVDLNRRREVDQRERRAVPTNMLVQAPAVVSRRQKIDRTSAGKLALAAIANARPTI